MDCSQHDCVGVIASEHLPRSAWVWTAYIYGLAGQGLLSRPPILSGCRGGFPGFGCWSREVWHMARSRPRSVLRALCGLHFGFARHSNSRLLEREKKVRPCHLRGLRLHSRALSSKLGLVREPLAHSHCMWTLLRLVGVSGVLMDAYSETGVQLRWGVEQPEVEVEGRLASASLK